MSGFNILERLRKFMVREEVKMNEEELLSTEYDNSEQLGLWMDIYEGNAPWLKDATYDSVGNLVEGPILDSGVGAGLVAEVARLSTLKLETKITGGERAAILDDGYQLATNNLRFHLEGALAKGSMIMKPFEYMGKIGVQFRSAETFIPKRFNVMGELTDVIFLDSVVVGDEIYTKTERHTLDEDTLRYSVENKLYVRDEDSDDELGENVPLHTIEKWKGIEEPYVEFDSPIPLFVYFKPPIANNTNTSEYLGVSMLSKAVGLLKELDKLYSSTVWEFEGNELAIHADATFFGGESGIQNKRLYKRLDSEEGSLFEVFNPDIRDESFFNGFNRFLRRVEFNVGLAYGTISEVNDIEKTAEEVRSTKERTYNTVTQIQEHLENALIKLVHTMDIIADLRGLEGANDEDYEVSFHWDGSSAIDEKTELAILLDEVKSGIVKPEYYVMKRYGITLEEAIERVPQDKLSDNVKDKEKAPYEKSYNVGKDGKIKDDASDKGEKLTRDKSMKISGQDKTINTN